MCKRIKKRLRKRPHFSIILKTASACTFLFGFQSLSFPIVDRFNGFAWIF
jgi:hypothetical protein